MVEFTMSAFARYPDGSTGDAFAEVSCRTPVACFAVMAVEVARWMPAALHAERGEVPEAIEMTLGWRDEAASLTALPQPQPQGPHDHGALEARAERGEVLRPERRGAVCVARPATGSPVRALPCTRRRERRRVALHLPQPACGAAEAA